MTTNEMKARREELHAEMVIAHANGDHEKHQKAWGEWMRLGWKITDSGEMK